MSEKTIIEKPNGEIWCYGDIHWDSNFEVVCDNEEDDCIVPGLTNTNDDPVTTWQEVIDSLVNDNWDINEIEQISTC